MKNRQPIIVLLAGCFFASFVMPALSAEASAPTKTPEPLSLNQDGTQIEDTQKDPDPLHLNHDGAQEEDMQKTTPWFITSEDADGQRLWSQTKLLFGVGLVTVGVLYSLPESFTNWDRDDGIQDLPDRWWKNVSRRPVWDKDDWAINYIGHTYSGGVYYMMARKSGYNQWDSFVYTTLMSTFLWEYGIEAFAERPSIQDLVVTPLGGWLYGEWAYRCEQRIEENDNRVLGSQTIGGVSLFLLDPIDHLGQGVNRLFGREWVLTGRVTLRPQTHADQLDGSVAMNSAITPGLRMSLQRAF